MADQLADWRKLLDEQMGAALTNERYREGPDTDEIARWAVATHSVRWGMGLAP